MKQFFRALLVAFGLMEPQAEAQTGYLIFRRDLSPAQVETLRDSLEGMTGVTSVTLGPIVTTADYERRLEVAKDLETALNAVFAPYATEAGPSGLIVALTPTAALSITTATPDVRQYATVVVAAGTTNPQKQRIAKMAKLNVDVLDIQLTVPANPTDYLARRRVHWLMTAYIQSQLGNVGDLLQPPPLP